MRGLMWVALVAVAFSACGETKLLGSRTPPDETKVIDGPTLAVPPDFNLRPPSQAEDYEAVLRAQKTREAEQVILGGAEGVSSTAASGGDAWLLEQAGTAEEGIRDKLVEEAEAKPEETKTKKSFWQRITGGGDKKDE